MKDGSGQLGISLDQRRTEKHDWALRCLPMNSSTCRLTDHSGAAVLGWLAIVCLGASGFTSCGGGSDASPLPIEVDPFRVEWTVEIGDPMTQSRSVSVTQAEGLSVTVSYDGQPPADWLAAAVTTTGNTRTVLLTASPQDLGPGVYNGFVTVAAPEYQSASIDVSLTIIP